MAGNLSRDGEDPLMQLRKERTSLGSTTRLLGNAEAYAYNKEQTNRSMREMISTQIRPTAKQVKSGIVVKKVDFFIRQDEMPSLSIIKNDSDMEPEPLENDYLVRLKVQLDTLPISNVGPIGLQISAKCYRWEESYGGLHKLGSDQVSFGQETLIGLNQ
ncbi:unnamed protein product [Calypogeia fissa]